MKRPAARLVRPEPLDVDVLCQREEHAQDLVRALSSALITAALTTKTAVHIRAAGDDVARAHELVRTHAQAAEIIRREPSHYPHFAVSIRDAESALIARAIYAKATEFHRHGRVRPGELEQLHKLTEETVEKFHRRRAKP